MVAAETILLSSPPRHGFMVATPPSMAQHTKSSSPGLPSLSDLLVESMPQPTSGSKVTAVPAEATVGLANARSLLQLFHRDKQDNTQPSHETVHTKLPSSNQGSTDKGIKEKVEKSRKELDRSEHARARRKSKSHLTSKTSVDTVIADGVANEGLINTRRKTPNRKPRKDGQTKIKKTKVIKPWSSFSNPKRPKKASIEDILGTAITRYDIEANISGAENTSAAHNEQDLGLVEASKRRRDWTPARDTLKALSLVDQSEAAWSALIPCESPSLVESPTGGLLKRLGEYGFGGADQAAGLGPHPQRGLIGQAATKKRKLDLVAGLASAASKAVVAKGSRSPKKRPQTITEKATAPFVLEDQAGNSTLLKYFSDPHRSTDPSMVLSSQRQEASYQPYEEHGQLRKAKSTKPKVNKKVKEHVPLHPPEVAVRMANEQNLLFGTSSQLARDESPTFIRDLQRAVNESEAVDDSQPLSQNQDSQISAESAASTSSNTRLLGAARQMWSVAARDDEGQLLDVDVVDLVDTPQAPRSFPTVINSIGTEEGVSVPPTAAASAIVDKDWRTVDNSEIKLGAALSNINQQQTESLLPRSVAEASLRARPQRKSPVKKSKTQKNQETLAREGELYPEMPNYCGYTDNDLKKEVTATGFKDIRKREDRISHLKKCWHAAQDRRVLQSLPPNTSTPSSMTNIVVEDATKPNSPVKRRGRPPKNASALAVKDGAETTSTSSSKKPRGRPKKDASAQSIMSNKEGKASAAAGSLQQNLEPQLLDLPEADLTSCMPASPRHGVPPQKRASRKVSASLSGTKSIQDMAGLLTTITKAITTYPPTHDIKNLTPHEKLLLYHPIVLEDLADWLNDEGLPRVGSKETVSPQIAKSWCESQSVCCLWKENLRGGTRARYWVQ
ncbi:MAG: hypothetical protein Q9178_004393 [Gyalolechia marmorata]